MGGSDHLEKGATGFALRLSPGQPGTKIADAEIQGNKAA